MTALTDAIVAQEQNPYLLAADLPPVPPGGYGGISDQPLLPPHSFPPTPTAFGPSAADPSVSGPNTHNTSGNPLDSLNPLNALGSALAPLSSITDMAKLLAAAGAWIADRHNWVRILEIAIGLAGVFVGLELVSRELSEATVNAGALAALA